MDGDTAMWNPVRTLLGPRKLWRMVREVDLEAIRREAERPFRLLLVSAAAPDAHALAGLLTGIGGERHPWLVWSAPLEVQSALGTAACEAALVLSPLADLEPAEAAAIAVLQAAGVPVVTVVMGSAERLAGVARSGESARAVMTGVEVDDLAAVARGLLSVVASDRRLALARHLPALRRSLFTTLIDETARANAVYSLTAGLAEIVPLLDVPLNLADMVVLTKNQLVMSYRLALAAGKQGSPRNLIGELLGVVGTGFLLRQGARGLVGLIPVFGLVPKVAVAYAGTWAMGWAVTAWVTEGQRLSRSAARKLYRQALLGGRRVAETLTTRARREPKQLSGGNVASS
jgi:uncharacterized protein (DUF697 family)